MKLIDFPARVVCSTCRREHPYDFPSNYAPRQFIMRFFCLTDIDGSAWYWISASPSVKS